MVVKIIVPGEPKSKQRPRMNTRTGRTYTPKQTIDYEKMVRTIFIKSNQQKLEGYIETNIKAFFEIPKSFSKKKKELALKGELRPAKKDIDNIAKIILDSLNKIVYNDDRQVVKLIIEKYYSEDPRVEIIMNEV